MAIKLLDKPNVEGTSYEYPYGNIKDNPGDNTGTPVNKLVYADFHQFFAKLMAASGITYNDQPENAVDGFQYFLALIENVKSTIASEVPIYEDVSDNVTLHPNFSSSTVRCYKYKDNTIMLRVNAIIDSNIITVSELISGIPNGPGGQYVTGYFFKQSAGNVNKTPISLLLNGNKISSIEQINVASYDAFNIYLLYKAE